MARFDNELAVSCALSINCNMYDMFFVICFPFVSILVISCFIETVKVMAASYYHVTYKLIKVNSGEYTLFSFPVCQGIHVEAGTISEV